jgi:hypothetical protein
MRIAELVVAGIFAALGLRSLVHWVRRPFEGETAAEHALFALHVTARAGAWLALATLFLLYATVATTDPVTGERTAAEGRAFTDAAKEYAWFYVVVLGLAALQFVTGYFLGRRRPEPGQERGR